jgi:hypothetical protein
VSGTTIPVTFTPAACYQFDHWSDGMSGTANVSNLTLINSTHVIGNAIASPTALNVGGQFSVSLGGFSYSRATNTWGQTVTLTNNGPAIDGPVTLVADALTASVSMANAMGSTQCAAPAGSSYMLISAGPIASGQLISVRLQFNNPNGVLISYTPRVMAGSGLY